MRITIKLNDRSLRSAIKELEEVKLRIKRAQELIVDRLAEYGALRASLYYSVAQMNDDDIRPEISVVVDRSNMIATIYAKSKDVGFIEFGAGSRFASQQHPLNAEFGTGPGTWSDGPNGKGHWDDPKGWWYGASGQSKHTYGQPAAMAMYQTSLDIQQETERIVREVLMSV